ncbi:MAG TPA: acetolactate synthase [Opitutaceae bacterium]|nr:acetolactate synthase [Opitutaceae bacterium]
MDVTTSTTSDPVKQFSVFAENRVGRLHDLIALLRSSQVHVVALTVLDTTDSAIVRLILDDPDKARELMINNDFPFGESDVLAVEINDEGDLASVLKALLMAEINIHYVYSFIKRPGERAALALNVEDADVAAQSLNQQGFKVLSQRDISR